MTQATTHKVAIQVIEVWYVDIEAESEEQAIAKAYEMPVNKIREDGDHQTTETDYVEVVG